MKKHRIILAMMMIMAGAFTVNAQNDDEPQYLFQSGDTQVSGFGGVTVGFSSINDEFAVMTGGGGAVLLNQKYFFGGYGEGLSTSHNLDPQVVTCPDKYTLSFGHGGFWMGYIHKPNKLIHFNINTRLGWGGISLYDRDYDIADIEHCDRDNVFVLLPQIEMEINLTSWMKFQLGAGYRFVTGISNDIYSDKMFNQPNVQLGFMFGNFSPDK